MFYWELFVCCFLFLLSTSQGKKKSELTILGGEDAGANEFPYVVSLFTRKRNSNTGGFCTGSIIDDYWILTAAHCVEGATPTTHVVEVYAGSKVSFEGTNLRAEKWFPHDLYKKNENPLRVYNDIALIKLSEPISKAPNTAIAQIPARNEPAPTEGSTVIVAGFGIEGEGRLAQARRGVLKKANMRVKGICQTSLPFCIKSVNINGRACNGDSGGPMLYGDKVVGVSSTGTVCSSRNGDAQYTQVSPYINWIQNTMKSSK